MTSALFITSAATSSQPRAPLYLRQCLDVSAAISCSVIRRCVMNWPITTQFTHGRFMSRPCHPVTKNIKCCVIRNANESVSVVSNRKLVTCSHGPSTDFRGQSQLALSLLELQMLPPHSDIPGSRLLIQLTPATVELY